VEKTEGKESKYPQNKRYLISKKRMIAIVLHSLRSETNSSHSRKLSISINNNRALQIKFWMQASRLRIEIKKWKIQTAAIVTISEVYVMKEKRWMSKKRVTKRSAPTKLI
jgi:hypothetical protein